MAAAGFAYLPTEEARKVYSRLNDEADFVGAVPDLSELVIVNDPDSVLSVEEKNLINTGLEDERLRATFDLMSTKLRFALRFGYSWNWQNGDHKEYLKRQMSWRAKSLELLRYRIKGEPSHLEVAEDYALNAALSFYIRELFLQPQKAVKEHPSLPIPSEERILDIFRGGDYPEISKAPILTAAA